LPALRLGDREEKQLRCSTINMTTAGGRRQSGERERAWGEGHAHDLKPAEECAPAASAVVRVFYTDRWGRTGGVQFRFTGPVQPGTGKNQLNSNPNQNTQFKRFDRYTDPVRPVPSRLTKNRISGEFDVFSNLNKKLEKEKKIF
jgi:hypothetical protein